MWHNFMLSALQVGFAEWNLPDPHLLWNMAMNSMDHVSSQKRCQQSLRGAAGMTTLRQVSLFLKRGRSKSCKMHTLFYVMLIPRMFWAYWSVLRRNDSTVK